jgi:hypothetical protein
VFEVGDGPERALSSLPDPLPLISVGGPPDLPGPV